MCLLDYGGSIWIKLPTSSITPATFRFASTTSQGLSLSSKIITSARAPIRSFAYSGSLRANHTPRMANPADMTFCRCRCSSKCRAASRMLLCKLTFLPRPLSSASQAFFLLLCPPLSPTLKRLADSRHQQRPLQAQILSNFRQRVGVTIDSNCDDGSNGD